MARLHRGLLPAERLVPAEVYQVRDGSEGRSAVGADADNARLDERPAAEVATVPESQRRGAEAGKVNLGAAEKSLLAGQAGAGMDQERDHRKGR